ncbi:Saccharolysin [Drechslerella dactyloides]|uniref:Saccharolysin n=1 Tax=Drechslerella dactyloides TaxID=74499 RepID=A0AAD6J558_DREDA|nr:Saccharolysin [Drechslerella dactyloides]
MVPRRMLHKPAARLALAPRRNLKTLLLPLLLALSIAFILVFTWSPELALASVRRLLGLTRHFATYRVLPPSRAGLSTISKMSAFKAPQAPPTFKHSKDSLLKDTNDLIEKSRATLDRLAKEITPETATFDNVIAPLAADENDMGLTSHILGFYQYVSSDPAVREASSQADKIMSEYAIEAGMREDIFKLVNAVFKSLPSDIPPESKRLVEKLNTDFIRMGLQLEGENRDIFKQIKKDLSFLSIDFSKSLNEENGGNWFTADELKGVPQDVIDTLKSEDRDGTKKYFLSYKYPDLFPALKFDLNADVREKIFVGNENKCPENLERFDKTIRLRHKKAQLLGYRNHAEYVLAEKMAKTPEKVNDFLGNLRSKLTQGGRDEVEKLKSLKKSDMESRGLSYDDKYYLWDHRFYDRLVREKEFNIDENKIAEYFPLQKCVDGMLNIFEKLLGLKFIKVVEQDAQVGSGERGWHEDCKVYLVHDEESLGGQFVGYLYLDLHPREGKYGHAANFNLVPGFLREPANSTSRNYPATALVCNFSKPTPSKPSLLKHDEVVTLFHELGHGIHDLVSRTIYSRFHGTNTVGDFVEAPSQMLENWCWEPEQIKQLSSHYESGEPLPDDLIKALIASKHVNDGLFNLRQLHFGIFDMRVHELTMPEDEKLDSSKTYNQLRKDIAGLDGPDSLTFGHGQTTFGHLMGGYDAGYYGYLWSLVFACDMYYTGFKKNPMDPENGRKYRHEVLEKGGSRDEMESLKAFLGREPNSEAFFRELGIQA